MDRLLEGPLGVPLAEEHVMSRQSLGDVVHIFSHIRLTMRAEHIVLQVRTSITVSCKPWSALCCTVFMKRTTWS